MTMKNNTFETKHYNLSPTLFRQKFFRHYSIRILIGSMSYPVENKQTFNRVLLQNKITTIKCFTTSVANKFVMIIDFV